MAYSLITSELGKIIAVGRYGNETIHLIHCSETLTEISNDVAIPFLVAEEATNYARVHLVTDFSADEALAQVADYLSEEEGIDEPHIIGVFECKIVAPNT